PHSVAMRIIDHLEAVKVEHENGQALPIAGAAKAFIELFGEEAAIRQPGQGIVPGQIARLYFRGIELSAVSDGKANGDYDQDGRASRDCEVDPSVVPIVRQDLMFRQTHIDDQGKALHDPIGHKPLSAVLSATRQKRSSIGQGYPSE